MRLPFAVRWLLQHAFPDTRRDDLVGDLLEEMHAGRSRLWLWRQTLSAVAIANRSLPLHYAQMAVFSFAWCLPLATLPVRWHESAMFHAAFEHCIQFDWPYSAFATLPLELAPLLLPVWSGVGLYLLLHPRASHRFLRTLCGWLVGLPTILLLSHWFGWHSSLYRQEPVMLRLLPHHFVLLLPFAASLFLSTLAALPLPPRQSLRIAK